MADKATPPKFYDEHERRGSAADFLLAGLIEGRQHSEKRCADHIVVGSSVGGEDGAKASDSVQNREAVGDEVTPPKNYNGQEACRSAADVSLDMLIKNNCNRCLTPILFAKDQPAFDDDRPPDEPERQLEGALGPLTVKSGFKGKRANKKLDAMERGGGS